MSPTVKLNDNPELQDYDIHLETDAGHLDLLSRKVFHSGFSVRAVNAKWPVFRELFHGFEPVQVASMDESDVETIAADPRVIRNRRKLRAVIRNARHFCEVAATHGSWRAWLHGTRAMPYELRADTLRACLDLCGPSTVFWFLFEAGEATLDDKPERVR